MEKYDNVPFMVLEWVAGEESKGTDLRSWLRRGPLDLPLALRFTIDIVRGLIHANQKVPGIVHRDLKPDNVLINQSRQAKITDFGLATIAQMAKLDPDGLDETDMGQSRYVGNVVGTPAYMPPEQWRGDADIDFRADIYAVGCILYELLTGKWLYEGYTVSELRTKHLEAPIPALDSHLPAELKPILEGCLGKRREDRYARLDLLLAELVTLYQAHSDEPLPEVSAEAFTAWDYVNRGVTFANLGQHERAIADYDEAIRLDTTLAQAYNNRGTSYANLGQYERAIADYDEAIHLDPTEATAYLNRGGSYHKLGNVQRAIADFDEAIHLDSTYAKAYSGRGISYAKLGNAKRAITDFDKAMHLDSTYADAYYNRGISYAETSNDEDAIADFDEVIRLDSSFALAYYNRGLSYAKRGNDKRAIVDYDEAIRLDPTNVSTYSDRGISYSKMGNYERAIADYDETIRLDSTYAIVYLNKAVTLAVANRFEEALIWSEKAANLGASRAHEFVNQMRQMIGQTPTQANPNDP